MSDDIFKDIWQQLANIYGKVNAAVRVLPAATAGGQAATNTGGIGKAFAVLTALGANAGQRIAALGSSVAAARGGLVGLASDLAELSVTVYENIKAQLEQQRLLSKYNAAIARSFAIADIADFFREAKVGQGTAVTTNKLNESFTDLKNSLTGLRVFWVNFQNKLFGLMARLATKVVDLGAGVVDGLGSVFDSGVVLISHYLFGVGATLEEANKINKDRQRSEQRREEHEQQMKLSQPVELLFDNILNRQWGAIRDTRPRLFP